MTTPNRPRLLAATLAVAGLMLTGCFTDSTDQATTPARAVLDFQPVAALSPYSDDATINTRINAAETLVATDENGTPQPLLAESWTTTDTTVTFQLRPNVTFHDGTTLTAETVAHSLTHAFKSATRPKGLGKAELSAAATGDNQVTVTSAVADPILLQRFSDAGTVILAEGAYSGTDPNPVGFGTGPYKITKLNSTTATLEAYGDYWGTVPTVTPLTVDFISDATARLNGLRAGETHILKGVPVVALSELSSDSEITLTHVALPRVQLLHFNTTHGVFTDPAVRQAAAHALNPQVIIDTVYEGYATPARGSVFNRDHDWAASLPEPTFTTGTVPTTPIRLATWNDRAEQPEALEVVADQLRSAGFTVELTVADYATLETDLLAGAFDLVLGSRNYMIGAADPLSVISSDFTCEGGYNLSLYCDPEFDAKVDEALGISDTQDRNSKAAALSAELVDSAVVLPVLHDQAHLATRGYTGLATDPREVWLLTPNLTAK